MKRSWLLLVDAGINLFLGGLLIFFTPGIVHALGIPGASNRFYPNILGGVLFGVGMALVLEYYRRPQGTRGLGLGGAIIINLCGGAVLLAWLLFGAMNLPVRGRILLWGLAVVLIVISSMEGWAHLSGRHNRIEGIHAPGGPASPSIRSRKEGEPVGRRKG
jgi:hypothetical protein